VITIGIRVVFPEGPTIVVISGEIVTIVERPPGVTTVVVSGTDGSGVTLVT
jgi:hypothetical protein